MTATLAPHAVGLGWRRALASDLLADTSAVDFIEVVAENIDDASKRLEMGALAHVWPVVVHGVSLSLGGAAPRTHADQQRERAFVELAHRVHAAFASEHISFTRALDAQGHELDIGHLTALPRTPAAARVVADNARRVQRKLGDVPLLLENVAWSVRTCNAHSHETELDEASFVRTVLEESGCGLLLDVANLYANAKNEGLDASAVLAAYPLERVRMIHIAGSSVDAVDGFVYDTHAHAVPEDVLALLRQALARCGRRPVLLERDRGFHFADHVREVERLRAIAIDADLGSDVELDHTSRGTIVGAAERAALGAWQHRLARALVHGDNGAREFDDVELGRARAILARKDGERAQAPPKKPSLAARVRSRVAASIPRL
ncbi:MAG TPA: DUF692 domain-containing protein [Myxococcota bacterium]